MLLLCGNTYIVHYRVFCGIWLYDGILRLLILLLIELWQRELIDFYSLDGLLDALPQIVAVELKDSFLILFPGPAARD